MGGRPERAVDPGAGPVARFAHELRELRGRAGLTYREMARVADRGASTLSRAASGDVLPAWPVVLAYVQACGGDVREWEERWRAAVREEAREAAAGPGEGDEPPYRGLRRFEPADERLYFGRGDLVAALAGRLRDHRLVAVVGASGSGKSSLLRAGLVPVLCGENGLRPAAVRILTPGARPAAHAAALDPAPSAAGADTVVLVDQFEEVFTLCTDPAEREAFLARVTAAAEPGSRLRVVLAVRADFLGRCAADHRLAPALRDATVVVAPMGPEALREAVVKPAAAAGLLVERQLTARIVSEVAGEPGGLPLMSHALLETWRRRRGRTLTEQAWDAAGGLHGAVAATAEDVHGRLSADEAAEARRVLLRLVSPGDGTPDTRRPATRADLDTGSPHTDRVLDELARARLLTLDGATVDLAHEALLTGWPRLRGWIEEDRELLRVHRHLTEAAAAWHVLDHDPGALYRGTRLSTARTAFTGPAARRLTPPEAHFLTAAITAHDHEEHRTARARRRLRRMVGSLSVLLILALAASLIAWNQTRVSEQQRKAAQAAQRVALSRQLAAQSVSLLGGDPDLASLLAVEAYRESPTKEAVGSLFGVASSPLRKRLAVGQPVDSMAVSPNGRYLAIVDMVSDLHMWDMETSRVKLISHQDKSGILGSPAVTFSPDGRTLAVRDRSGVRLRDARTGRLRSDASVGTQGASLVVFDGDRRSLVIDHLHGALRIRDVGAGRLVKNIGAHISDFPLAVHLDTHTLVTGTPDRTIRLWDIATGNLRIQLHQPTSLNATGSLHAVLSSDGRLLATSFADRTVRLYEAATGRLLATLAGHAGVVTSLAFSPDGRTLASGSADATIRLWDTASGKTREVLKGHSGLVGSLVFGPGGRTLVSGGEDGAVRLWNCDPASVRIATHLAGSDLITFSPGGHDLVVSADNGTIQSWETGSRSVGRLERDLPSRPAPVNTTARRWKYTTPQVSRYIRGGKSQSVVVFGSNGHALVFESDGSRTRLRDTTSRRTLATTNVGVNLIMPGSDGRTVALIEEISLWLWDTVTGKRSYVMQLPGNRAAAFSETGLLASSDGGSVTLYDTKSDRIRTLTPHDIPHLIPEAVVISPDGRTLAIAEPDAITLWGTVDHRIRKIPSARVASMAFSPDGRILAAGGDGKVQVWDVSTGLMRSDFSTVTDVFSSIAFSPNGHVLAAINGSGALWQWAISTSDPTGIISHLCQAVRRNLTAQERTMYLPDQPPHPTCPLQTEDLKQTEDLRR